jgi:hypothetical protein
MPPRECPISIIGLPLARTRSSLSAPSNSSAKVKILPVVAVAKGAMNARESYPNDSTLALTKSAECGRKPRSQRLPVDLSVHVEKLLPPRPCTATMLRGSSASSLQEIIGSQNELDGDFIWSDLRVVKCVDSEGVCLISVLSDLMPVLLDFDACRNLEGSNLSLVSCIHSYFCIALKNGLFPRTTVWVERSNELSL